MKISKVFKDLLRNESMEIEDIHEKGALNLMKKENLEDGTTMKILMKKLVLQKYYRSILVEIDEEEIEEARMEAMERE